MPVKTIAAWADALGASIHHSSHDTLPSLTRLAYCVHAVETAQNRKPYYILSSVGHDPAGLGTHDTERQEGQ
jgi:hypothetical protein